MQGMSPDCERDLAAVGVTDAQIATASTGTNILNGLGYAGATTSYAQAAYGNTQAFNAVSAEYGNVSVARYMELIDPTAAAIAQLNGSNIYINAAWINGMSYVQQEGLLLHEMLHNITSQGDEQLQADLNLKVGAASQNIGDKLQRRNGSKKRKKRVSLN
jgi:hypothetical protein